jgi:hypothetical protein
MKRTVDINDLLLPIEDMPYQAYLSNALQVADILQWIIDQTGKARVWMTSFSISEEFLRRLFFIEKSGLIESMNIVLDFKATNKTLILWPFIRQTVEHCYLADNHSKILLVENDKHRVAVVTSQNLTRGNRFECGYVSCDAHAYAVLKQQMLYLIEKQSVSFDEIYDRTVNSD